MKAARAAALAIVASDVVGAAAELVCAMQLWQDFFGRVVIGGLKQGAGLMFMGADRIVAHEKLPIGGGAGNLGACSRRSSGGDFAGAMDIRACCPP